MKGKRENVQWMILGTAFLGYLIFNGILLGYHEAWRDEANVWLMARELSPLQLFEEIRYQGHPCLWYLLLMPAAKIGLPFQTIHLVSYLIMAVVAGIFLFKAPLFTPVKVIAVFSPIFTYYYPVIARNYCLAALLMVLLAVCYTKRNKTPVLYGMLLGLLVQTDVIALAPAGMISLMWLCENVIKSVKSRSRKPLGNMLKGIWIPLVSLIFLIMQFYHVSDSTVFAIKEVNGWEFIDGLQTASERIFWGLTGRGEEFAAIWSLLFLILGIVLAVSVRDLWPMLVMVISYIFQLVFIALIYSLHTMHFIFLCFVLIWTIWILEVQKKQKNLAEKRIVRWPLIGMQLLLAVLSICAFIFWNSDEQSDNLSKAISHTYSDGIHAARYIEENLSSDEVFVSDHVPRASTVIAYLDDEYNFYYAGSGEKTTYADWSEKQKLQISLADLNAWVKSTFPDKEVYYLLVTRNSCVQQAEKLEECEILYRTQEETTKGEEYTLYRICNQ